MFYLWHEAYDKSHPKFSVVKFQDKLGMQQYERYENLDNIIGDSLSYQNYEHYFLLDDSKIYEQIAALNKNSGANITDFAYAIEDNIFILYFETSDNEGISSSECTKLLKEQYKEPYFKDVVACKIDNGSQLLYRELVNYKYNISNDRLSPIRLITTKAQRMFFEGCILKEGDN